MLEVVYPCDCTDLTDDRIEEVRAALADYIPPDRIEIFTDAQPFRAEQGYRSGIEIKLFVRTETEIVTARDVMMHFEGVIQVMLDMSINRNYREVRENARL